MNVQRTALALFLISCSSAAVAHPGHADGFLAAVAHPWLGWDHLLAMVLVGVLASGYSGLRGLALPVAFVASLMAAAARAFGAERVMSEVIDPPRLALVG